MRLPRSYGSRIYFLHLLAVATGIVLVISGWWRYGVVVVGASFIGAATFRTIVPLDHTGMLRVRGKAFDVIWMGFLGVSLVVLGLVVPS